MANGIAENSIRKSFILLQHKVNRYAAEEKEPGKPYSTVY